MSNINLLISHMITHQTISLSHSLTLFQHQNQNWKLNFSFHSPCIDLPNVIKTHSLKIKLSFFVKFYAWTICSGCLYLGRLRLFGDSIIKWRFYNAFDKFDYIVLRIKTYVKLKIIPFNFVQNLYQSSNFNLFHFSPPTFGSFLIQSFCVLPSNRLSLSAQNDVFWMKNSLNL